MNRLASLRLTERCADILISVREEIIDAGYTVAEELNAPISKLNECVTTSSTSYLNLICLSAGPFMVFSTFSPRWAAVPSSNAI
jgi:hypothetical protein